MRPGRAAWITLNVASYVCAILFIIFSIICQISTDWIVYDVASVFAPTSFDEVSRTRGIWRECASALASNTDYDGVCQFLEPFFKSQSYGSEAQTILNMRISIVALQIIATVVVGVTIIISCIFLILAWKKPDIFKPRTAQYTALIAGAILWLMAFTHFISLLIYYEVLSQENYRNDPALTSARSAWSDATLTNTYSLPGSMIPVNWSGCVLLYAASMFQLGASALQDPPMVEM